MGLVARDVTAELNKNWKIGTLLAPVLWNLCTDFLCLFLELGACMSYGTCKTFSYDGRILIMSYGWG